MLHLWLGASLEVAAFLTFCAAMSYRVQDYSLWLGATLGLVSLALMALAARVILFA